MLAAGWAAPGYPMQGHVAVSAHTVGTVVVIDKASPKLGALPTNHLGWQVGKNSLIPVGLPLQCTNSHSELHNLPPLRGCPLRSGPLGCQPVCSIALPLPLNTYMSTGLAVVPAFCDGIEGLLAAHAHGHHLVPHPLGRPEAQLHGLQLWGSGVGTSGLPCPLPEALGPLPTSLWQRVCGLCFPVAPT